MASRNYLLLCFSFIVIALAGATKYTVDTSMVCDKTLKGVQAQVALDGHIRGPLIAELEEHFSKDNPFLEFAITTEYSDCNTCNEYGCTLMGCDSYWKAKLHIRGLAGTPLDCSMFVRDWTLPEMRLRWRRSLDKQGDHGSNYPFKAKDDDGDFPTVSE